MIILYNLIGNHNNFLKDEKIQFQRPQFIFNWTIKHIPKRLLMIACFVDSRKINTTHMHKIIK